MAYLEQDSNESFNIVLQNILAHPPNLSNDLVSKIRNLENAGFLHMTDFGGQNLIHAAAQAGNYDLISYLIDRGLDFDSKDRHGWSPLVIAVNARQYRLAEFLLKKGADPCIVTNSNGNLFHYLMKNYVAGAEMDPCFMTIFNCLASNNVDVNAKDDYGETPLTYLCEKDPKEPLVSMLLLRGAKINISGK